MKICFSAGLAALVSVAANFQSLLADDFSATTEPVGRNGGTLTTPVNQLVTPSGTQVELPGMRPQALALSPDGKLLVTAGSTPRLVVLNPATGSILQHVRLPAAATDDGGAPVAEGLPDTNETAQLSYTGLAFAPDGSRIYMANVDGDIKVFGVGKHRRVAPLSVHSAAARQRQGPHQ